MKIARYTKRPDGTEVFTVEAADGNRSVITRAEAIRLFEELDPFVIATAPDTPTDAMQRWSDLHDLMTPEYLAARERVAK